MQRWIIMRGVALTVAASLLTAGLVLPAAEAGDSVTAGTVVFDDAPVTHRFHDSIAWLVQEGITSGTSPSTFSPSAGITRAQMAVFLWRYRGSPTPTRPHAFADVPIDTAYADAVAWLSESGITSGISESRFGPNEVVSRQQMAMFLHRIMGEPGVSQYMVAPDPAGGSEYVPITGFEDVTIGSAATMAILWLVEAGVTNGTSESTFSPSAPVTRGQMARFLHGLPVVELRVFYAIPSDQGSPGTGLFDAISHELSIADDWFRDQTGGSGLRMTRDTSGQVPVSLIGLPGTSADLVASSTLFQQLRTALPDTLDVHLVYVDTRDSSVNTCGRGGGGLAVIYLGSACQAPSIARATLSGHAKVAAHEIVHAMGAVPTCAPNGDSDWGIGHVSDNSQDLMYAGSKRNTTENWVLDPGRDDYYGHGRTDCPDLARHPIWSS